MRIIGVMGKLLIDTCGYFFCGALGVLQGILCLCLHGRYRFYAPLEHGKMVMICDKCGVFVVFDD